MKLPLGQRQLKISRRSMINSKGTLDSCIFKQLQSCLMVHDKEHLLTFSYSIKLSTPVIAHPPWRSPPHFISSPWFS